MRMSLYGPRATAWPGPRHVNRTTPMGERVWQSNTWPAAVSEVASMTMSSVMPNGR